MNKILLSIQVLPSTSKTHPYLIIDKVIKLIASKGYNYKVCPFETVVECQLDEAFQLINEVHNECYLYDTNSLLLNIKIYSIKDNDVFISDLTSKYK